MSAPINVLAVMDSAWVGASTQARSDAMREARVAVAELIEAVPRAIQMLHVAGARAISFQADATTNYDDANCDGYCVHGDCIAALTALQAALARVGAA